MVAIAIIWTLAYHQTVALRSGKPVLREFMAFYTVGYLLNRSPEMLYDPDAYNQTYHSLFPHAPASLKMVYAHAPFEGLVFRPFALMPFERALVAWQLVSLVLIATGFALVWRSSDSLPARLLPLALLVALSFAPIAVATVTRGQTSALSFFAVALAVWCQARGRDYWSGAALAFCLSKPTFLVLVLPMLVVGRRWCSLIGLMGGAGLLGFVSLLAVGWRGCVDYVTTVLFFADLATARTNAFVLSDYVDLNSFFRMVSGGRGHLAIGALALVAAVVAPFLVRSWRGLRTAVPPDRGLVWASTLTWTTVLNLYMTSYDSSIIVIGIVLMADRLCRGNGDGFPPVFRALLVMLYIVPWIPVLPVGAGRTLQPYTLVLVALGVYQAQLALRSLANGIRIQAQPAPEPTGRSRPR